MKFLYLLLSFPPVFLAAAIPAFSQQTRQSSWQQRADYFIDVKLNDKDHKLQATERVVYTNNSTNTLQELYFNLWPNAYRNTQTAFARQQLENGNTKFLFSKPEEKGSIDSLHFQVDGADVQWELLADMIDVCRIKLNKPLPPGGSITVSTPFVVKIPGVFSRMGHKDQFYAITQWYPKPAVYDANGWNYMPYLDQGEFYSEFGDFEVKITVPQNYIVAATGELQEKDEQQWLNELAAREETADSGSVTQKIVSLEEAVITKTLTYKQGNVHDFAWFASKKFKVAKGEVKLASGKVVSTWTFSPAGKKKAAVNYVNNAVKFYSEQVGEYPYNICTAVDGPLEAGGGMEYPTITICNGLSEEVVLHEVGHNWFYGILGSNEREHPWMDEGINSFYENLYYTGTPFMRINVKGNLFGIKDVDKWYMPEVTYLFNARKNEDQPLELPSYDYTQLNYGAIVYSKTPLMFKHLRAALGTTLYDSCMHTYYNEWKFRHPLPGDIQEVFERVSGQNLDWFFKASMQGTTKIDYALKKWKANADGTVRIKVKNKTGLAVPYSISSMSNGKIISTQWYKGFTGTRTDTFQFGKAESYVLDAGRDMPDVYRHNNMLRSKGLCKHGGGFQLKLLAGLEHPYISRMYVAPALGWNQHNGWMTGLVLYNTPLPSKKFEYVFTPMYAFATNDINGYASLRRSFYPQQGAFRAIDAGYDASRFRTLLTTDKAYYLRQAPYLRFAFRKKNMRSPVNNELKLRYVSVFDERDNGGMDYEFVNYKRRFWQGFYTYTLSKKLEPAHFSLMVENGKDFYNRYNKATVEFTKKINYGKPRKDLYIRFFAGAMDFSRSITGYNSDPGRYWLRLMDNTGYFDYTYSSALMGRGAYNGLFAQQVINHEGNMHALAGFGSSNKWVTSLNLRSSLPGIVPIRLFADIGTYAGASTAFPGSQQWVYVAGVMIPVKENIFEIYLPIAVSKDIKQVWDLNDTKYPQRISFMFNLNEINPFGMLRKISL